MLKYLLIIFLISVSWRVAGQIAIDTIVVDGRGEYDVCRGLSIFKTDEELRQDYVSSHLTSLSFKPLFPERTYSDRILVARHYWITFTIKNVQQVNAELFFK